MNQLKGVFWLLCFVLLACASAFPQAGFINVTANKLTNLSGAVVNNATICGQLEAQGVGYSVKVSGGGQTTQAPVCALVTNGSFSLMLPDTSITSPANACVDLTVTDNSNGTVLLGLGYDCVQPTSVAGSPWCSTTSGVTTCNFDLYSPSLPQLALTAPAVGGGGATVYSATSAQAGTVILFPGQTSNVLSKVATTGQYSDLLNAPTGGTSSPATSSAVGGVQLAAGQSSDVLSKVATTGQYADLFGAPAATAPATSTVSGTVQLATGQTSAVLSKVGTTGAYADLTGLPTLGAAAAHGASITVNNTNCSLDGLCFLPQPLALQSNGTANPNQNVLNVVAGTGITVTSASDGSVLISTGTSGGGTPSSVLPTPPSNAFVYSNLQAGEDSSCPTYSNAASQTQQSNCWSADSIDATGAAGAGIVAPTLVKFGITTPALSTGGSMQTSVSNAPATTTTGTGSSGASSIVVASVSNLNVGMDVDGTGLASNAKIAGSWDGVSTTIPLTAANIGAVSGTLTFTFTSNSVFFKHLLTGSPPTTPVDVTSPDAAGGTITVHAGTITADANGITFTGMTGTSSRGATIASIQVTIDGSTTPAFNSAKSQTVATPASTTIPLTPGNHTYTVKAWVGASNAVTSSGNVGIGGAVVANISNLLEDVSVYADPSNVPEAYEFDPDATVNGQQAYASLQCDIAAGSTAPGKWRLWNSLGRNWVTTTYSCAAFTPGAWHHLQLYATFDVPNHKYSYQTLVFDGVTVFQNLNQTYTDYTLPGGNTYTGVAVQNQLDNTSSTPRTGAGTTLYLDQYSLTAW